YKHRRSILESQSAEEGQIRDTKYRLLELDALNEEPPECARLVFDSLPIQADQGLGILRALCRYVLASLVCGDGVHNTHSSAGIENRCNVANVVQRHPKSHQPSNVRERTLLGHLLWGRSKAPRRI